MTGPARGRCPDCGRELQGRAVGPERRAADRRWVVLAPHKTRPQGAAWCQPRGLYSQQRVPRLDAPPARPAVSPADTAAVRRVIAGWALAGVPGATARTVHRALTARVVHWPRGPYRLPACGLGGAGSPVTDDPALMTCRGCARTPAWQGR